MVVVKKDGSRQSFERSKVLGGMIRACEKRPVPLAELERIAAEIEQDLQNSMEREIPSERIGEKVMERLRKVDQVAYVRFASVYRQFKDIDTFMEELTKLLAEK
jgi:transcriptional repressor NrdR